MKNKALVPLLLPPCYTLSVLTRKDDSPNAEGWIGDKSCLVTIDSGASVAIAAPDISAGVPKRELTRLYVLEMVSGEMLPSLKESIVKFTLRWCPLMTYMTVTKILHIHNVPVDLGCCVLGLSKEKVPLWCPGVCPYSSPCMKGSSNIVLSQCESRGGMAGRPLGGGGCPSGARFQGCQSRWCMQGEDASSTTMGGTC
jgi:hypothetical protein